VNPHVSRRLGPPIPPPKVFSDLMLLICQLLASRVVPSEFIQILQELTENFFVTAY